MQDDVLNAAPSTGVRFERETEIARLIGVLTQVYYRLDADIDQLRRDRYLEAATSRELDRRARPLGVTRPDGEGDDAFRRRALAGRVRSTSETTFEDFATAVLAVFDADPADVTLRVDYEDALGAVIVEVTSDLVDAAPFSVAVIEDLLEGSLPGSRRVVIRRTDGFQFSDPETTDDKSGAGFGEGVWTQ